MNCLLCHQKISRLRVWRTKSEFCCDEHAAAYKKQTLERLLADQEGLGEQSAPPPPLEEHAPAEQPVGGEQLAGEEAVPPIQQAEQEVPVASPMPVAQPPEPSRFEAPPAALLVSDSVEEGERASQPKTGPQEQTAEEALAALRQLTEEARQAKLSRGARSSSASASALEHRAEAAAFPQGQQQSVEDPLDALRESAEQTASLTNPPQEPPETELEPEVLARLRVSSSAEPFSEEVDGEAATAAFQSDDVLRDQALPVDQPGETVAEVEPLASAPLMEAEQTQAPADSGLTVQQESEADDAPSIIERLTEELLPSWQPEESSSEPEGAEEPAALSATEAPDEPGQLGHPEQSEAKQPEAESAPSILGRLTEQPPGALTDETDESPALAEAEEPAAWEAISPSASQRPTTSKKAAKARPEKKPEAKDKVVSFPSPRAVRKTKAGDKKREAGAPLKDVASDSALAQDPDLAAGSAASGSRSDRTSPEKPNVKFKPLKKMIAMELLPSDLSGLEEGEAFQPVAQQSGASFGPELDGVLSAKHPMSLPSPLEPHFNGSALQPRYRLRTVLPGLPEVPTLEMAARQMQLSAFEGPCQLPEALSSTDGLRGQTTPVFQRVETLMADTLPSTIDPSGPERPSRKYEALELRLLPEYPEELSTHLGGPPQAPSLIRRTSTLISTELEGAESVPGMVSETVLNRAGPGSSGLAAAEEPREPLFDIKQPVSHDLGEFA